jgi:hypothetical protein
LGPYQLHEQVPQDEYSEGTLFRATHVTSGTPALVFKPAEGGAVPLKDWRVSLISSASPGYFALEVEDTPHVVDPDKHSVESLVFTFEDVREEVEHMDRVAASRESRPRWRLGLGLTGAAAVGALLFALARLVAVSQPSSDPEPVTSAESVLTDHDVPAAKTPAPSSSGSLADTAPQGEPVLARPLPREPFKGQKRPPCTRYAEVELIGACWTPHKLKAPCPDVLYEYQGECYVPTYSAKPPPQSLEP